MIKLLRWFDTEVISPYVPDFLVMLAVALFIGLCVGLVFGAFIALVYLDLAGFYGLTARITGGVIAMLIFAGLVLQ